MSKRRGVEAYSCDGYGRARPESRGDGRDEATLCLTRRGMIAGLSLGLLGWVNARSALAHVGVGRESDHVLVVVFLRGGADGLALVAPFGDDGYTRLRPNLSIPKKDLHRLDDFFGLPPSLRPLAKWADEGKLRAIHAVGSDDGTRSHFEAMDTMERGIADRVGPGTGWVARHLLSREVEPASPLRAVAFSHTTPTAFLGATHATTLNSLADFRLRVPDGNGESVRQELAKLYANGQDEVSHAGREALRVLEELDRLDVGRPPSNGAAYPDSGLGAGLKQTAQLIRTGVGLEIAYLESGGWDSHVAQGATVGLVPSLLDDLGRSLDAFARDLGPRLDKVTVVVMSEFGRRLAENAALGTDHGHGGAMLLLGGGVKGGPVFADWPGLDHAVGPGDLACTTDYRDVLGEVLGARFPGSDLGSVFPNHARKALGLMG